MASRRIVAGIGASEIRSQPAASGGRPATSEESKDENRGCSAGMKRCSEYLMQTNSGDSVHGLQRGSAEQATKRRRSVGCWRALASEDQRIRRPDARGFLCVQVSTRELSTAAVRMIWLDVESKCRFGLEQSSAYPLRVQ
jgi:hypothetical protein